MNLQFDEWNNKVAEPRLWLPEYDLMYANCDRQSRTMSNIPMREDQTNFLEVMDMT